jgi:hypothetical protein
MFLCKIGLLFSANQQGKNSNNRPSNAYYSKEVFMETENNNCVVITDVKMPFISMVVFMVKAAIAAIPALIILAILGAIIVSVIGGISGG